MATKADGILQPGQNTFLLEAGRLPKSGIQESRLPGSPCTTPESDLLNCDPDPRKESDHSEDPDPSGSCILSGSWMPLKNQIPEENQTMNMLKPWEKYLGMR